MLSRAQHWWHQWRALLPWERRLVLELVWRMAVVWWQLRLYSTGQLIEKTDAAILLARRRPLPPGWQESAFAHRCDKLAAIAAYHGLYQATCLPRSLALYSVLGMHGLPARLRFGVLPGSRPLMAHAWVECDGEVLGDSVDAFQPFMSLGEPCPVVKATLQQNADANPEQ